MTTPTTDVSELEQIARRFPLVPRHQPALPPLDLQLADVAELARTSVDHPDVDARIATAHNKAALVASNCGHPDLARALCWHHHHRYLDRQPWTAVEARLALEPLVNLARLHIRSTRPDAANELLESLLSAVGSGGVAEVDGRPVGAHDAIATPVDRRETRRWLWAVTLAEGLRALARAGRWDDAVAHADRHRGIGSTLLDGRQIAVLAHVARGDHADATTLLADTAHAEPWQLTVAHVLDLMIRRRGGTSAAPHAARLIDLRPVTRTTGLFAVHVQLAVATLVDAPARSAMLAEVTRSAAVTTDAALARAVLTHPVRQHLPASLLDHLAAVHRLAAPETSASWLENALTDALTGRRASAHATSSRQRSRQRPGTDVIGRVGREAVGIATYGPGPLQLPRRERTTHQMPEPGTSDDGSVDLMTDRAHTARVYDYFLGGKDDYTADREAAATIESVWLSARISARTNRAFMNRAARYAAEQGIDQFLDIGTGIPTEPNLHQIVQQLNPAARIVYVDNDPIVLAHASALLTGTPEGAVAYLHGDARNPTDLLDSAALADTIDIARPIAISLIGLMHFLDDDQAAHLVHALLDASTPGSYLIMAHGTLDFDTEGEVARARDSYSAAGMTMHLSDAATIQRTFLAGLAVIEPGLVVVERWRPDRDVPSDIPDSAVSNYGVVAKIG